MRFDAAKVISFEAADAEFVEDDSTLAALASIGVDYAQGYAISRPVPIELDNQDDSSLVTLARPQSRSG